MFNEKTKLWYTFDSAIIIRDNELTYAAKQSGIDYIRRNYRLYFAKYDIFVLRTGEDPLDHYHNDQTDELVFRHAYYRLVSEL
jgi:hypothetical protein